MRSSYFSQVILAFAAICIPQVFAADAMGQAPAAAAAFDPRVTFAPLTLPDPVNGYRSSNGAPGPLYWQNQADYELHAQLDVAAKQLRGTATITYTNNSPDTLTSLWLHLEQNVYRKDSRAATMGNRVRPRARQQASTATETPSSEGFVFDSLEVEAGTQRTAADYSVYDTRMQLRLATPLAGHGGQLKIHMRYHYQIPGVWGGRTSWGMSEKGEIYDIAQWYPRMAVYDDLRGWDALPYLGSEFYLEYGSFEYYVTVPASFLVVGSGELVNEKEVLTAAQVKRLAQARASDQTVYIRTPAEVGDPASRPRREGTLTWHFRMDHTRDVVWSASPVFVWDAARINLPGGKSALAMSAYPPESVGADAWDRSTEYVKDTVERFSKHWFAYPWPAAVNVAGFSTGMEYPGVAFDGIKEKGSLLFWITAHEIGHCWFPMIVGSNERRNAFMDEGFNTFIDIEESAAYAGGKYGPKRDGEYSAGGEPSETILKVLDNPAVPSMLMRADAIPWPLAHPVSYFKGAHGLVLLREQILGPERFDWAFRKYVRDWAFKHPAPSDFFRAMQSEAGEDLNWFWRGWYMNNWTFDMAVTEISGQQVTIANRGQLVFPATVEAKFRDGTSVRVKLPVETWLTKTSAVWNVGGDKPIASVVVDPDHALPDDDRSNNEKSE